MTRRIATSSRRAGGSVSTDCGSAVLAPADLSERARELWSEVVPRRANTPERIVLVRVALEALSRADEANELVAREGIVIAGGKMPHAHPALKIERDAIATFTRTWTALGLTRNVSALAGIRTMPGTAA